MDKLPQRCPVAANSVSFSTAILVNIVARSFICTHNSASYTHNTYCFSQCLGSFLRTLNDQVVQLAKVFDNTNDYCVHKVNSLWQLCLLLGQKRKRRLIKL